MAMTWSWPSRHAVAISRISFLSAALHRQSRPRGALADRRAVNVPDRATFFGGGAAGYTDYPVLTPAERDAAWRQLWQNALAAARWFRFLMKEMNFNAAAPI